MKITLEIDFPDDFAAEDDRLTSWLDLDDDELGDYARRALVTTVLAEPHRFPPALVETAEETAAAWLARERADDAERQMRKQKAERHRAIVSDDYLKTAWWRANQFNSSASKEN